MMELISGEAGVLRTALGVVLGMEGIDARVRVYLWSGGVEDAVLPTMNGAAIPAGAQVIVTFLSDRTASGMVLGTVEGLLSWRRIAPPAFAERLQVQLQETRARCTGLDAPADDRGGSVCGGGRRGGAAVRRRGSDGGWAGVFCAGRGGGHGRGDPAAHLGSAHGGAAHGGGRLGGRRRHGLYGGVPAAGRAGVLCAVVGVADEPGVRL